MRKFAETILRYRLAVIIITLGLTLFFGYGLTKVSINSDMLSYLKPDDPVVKLFNRIGEDYGGNTLALVAVGSDSIFSVNTLSLIKDLTEKYGNIKGVSSVMSLTNILDIKKTDFGLEISKLIDKNNLPRTREELDRLKAYTLDKDMYAGKIISKDGRFTLLICRLQNNIDKGAVAEKIKSITENLKGNHEVYYNGLPLQMVELNGYIVGDLGKLIPIVVLVVILILYLSFRSKRGVILPLTTVVISSIWAMGLMGWTGVDLSMISNIMPILLIAIGTAYGIHFISKYNEDVRAGDDKISGIKDALSEVGIPILLTGVTTLIGFLSFIGSTLTAVTDFGIFTAFGVGVAMMLSVTFLPAVLSYMDVKNVKTVSGPGRGIFIKFMDVLGKFVLKNEKPILAGVIVIIIVAVFGIPKIKTEVNMSEYSPENSNLRISDALMRSEFGGSLPIQIIIKGDIKNPFVLKEMYRLEKYMESIPDVNNTQSIADLICNMNEVMNGHYTIPETRDQVANLLFMLEGEDIIEQLVNKDYSEGIVQASFGSMDTKLMTNTVIAIDNYLNTELDSNITIAKISELKPEQLRKIRDYQVKRISAELSFDARKRESSARIDRNKIERALKTLTADMAFPLTDQYESALKERLRNFFFEEADVEIESADIINNLVELITTKARNAVIPEPQIARLLRKNIPPRYWREDPEIIESTAEFIFTIIEEQHNKNRVSVLVKRLIRLFPPELQQNKKFRTDIRDDLWALNEQIIGLPAQSKLTDSPSVIHLSAQQSGMLIVMKKMNDEMLTSQIRSLFIALGLVLILMVIQFKSVKMGLIVTSPILLTVLVNFAVMGYFDIALDNATMMIASIAIGIGIDYAIHFSSRFKSEIKARKDKLRALDKTLETTGKAIVINALTVALGFMVLTWSNMVPMQLFGWLIALTMGVSAWAALTFLPALILFFRKG
ncbi:MAG: MMPL family transporter [FCB group bacterium]|nr:MMPL family transporter [FCB group bacterium]